uniref:Uncharacterized protein n=1 Tax=Onchocerca volvulus TaxID=6282 RepID=A0A8R1TPI5_ONCVO
MDEKQIKPNKILVIVGLTTTWVMRPLFTDHLFCLMGDRMNQHRKRVVMTMTMTMMRLIIISQTIMNKIENGKHINKKKTSELKKSETYLLIYTIILPALQNSCRRIIFLLRSSLSSLLRNMLI